MILTQHHPSKYYVVTYTEIDIIDTLHQLYHQDYQITFGARMWYGELHSTITIETDMIGAVFMIDKENRLIRTFYSLKHIADHGTDCLPWYQIPRQKWDVEVDLKRGHSVLSSRIVWPKLTMAIGLEEL